MANQIAKDANEFIEQQLRTHLEDLERNFSSDVLSFNGALTVGVDNLLRNVVEEKKEGNSKDALTMLLTTGGGYIEVVHRIVDTLRHHYGGSEFCGS